MVISIKEEDKKITQKSALCRLQSNADAETHKVEISIFNR